MKRFLMGTLIGVGTLFSGMAMAQTSTTSRNCEAIQEQAAGSAALLLSPSAALQGIKYPATGTFTAVGGSTTSNGYQVRLAFLWSPLDAYKSTLIRQLADKNCTQQTAMVEAQEALEWLNDVGKEQSLINQIQYLNEQEANINSVLEMAHNRLEAGTATVMDSMVLQQAAASLELKHVQAQGQLNALQAKNYTQKVKSFDELMLSVKTATMSYEQQASKVRALDAWKIDIQGGVIPPMTTQDTTSWFGMVGITYNFGDIAMRNHESHYLDARNHELSVARYELSDQLSRFRQVVKANIEDMRRQNNILNDQSSNLSETLHNLQQHPDTPGAQNAIALINLQLVDVGSNRVLAQNMLTELNKFYGEEK